MATCDNVAVGKHDERRDAAIDARSERKPSGAVPTRDAIGRNVPGCPEASSGYQIAVW
jgi:hypothetical protein